jgi:hypothetical protein
VFRLEVDMTRSALLLLPLTIAVGLAGTTALDTTAAAVDLPAAGWTMVDDGTGVHPDGEYDVAMALFPAAPTKPAEVIAFGGYRNATDDYSDNTWAWDGQHWRLVATSGPPAVGGAAMARNRRGDLMLFGGADAERTYRGTWQWDGTSWTKLANGPLLASPVMAYDVDMAKVVLTGTPFGGGVMQTWLWDGTDSLWKYQHVAHAPPAAVDTSLTYINGYRNLVLFGGRDPVTLQPTNSTYLFGGTVVGGYDWTLAAPATSPPARSSASMAYRPTPETAREVVLFGGFDGNGDLGDTWVWDGLTWSERTQATAPPAQNSAAMSQLPGGVLLLSNDGTTWEWAAADTQAPAATTQLYGTNAAGFTWRSKVQVAYGVLDELYGSGARTVDVRWRQAAYDGPFGSWHRPAAWQDRSTAYEPFFKNDLRRGFQYCFSARGTDWAGNVGAWSEPTCVSRLLDDIALRTSGGWVREHDPRYYADTYVTTRAQQATLTRTHAQVSQIAILVVTSPRAGSVKVTVGGETVGRWSLRRSDSVERKVLLVSEPFSYRSGTVKVIVTSDDRPVVVDGLGLLR